jgi:hypothetical protein
MSSRRGPCVLLLACLGCAAKSSAARDAAATMAGADEAPERPLAVDAAAPQLYTWQFKPSEADPQASVRDEVQTAVFDSRAPVQGKLVVTLSGLASPPGPDGLAAYAASLGFHAFAVAYQNAINPSTQSDPDFFGQMRWEAFDGSDRTPAIDVGRPDCVEVRVAKALAYLQAKNAASDWAYYLKKDGSVRWSDVIFIGHSHGASSAAFYGKVRRLWRAISLSGPRDTNPVVATWLTMPSATPIDRFYGFTGTMDDQHPDHIKAMDVMGYVGALTDVEQAPAPFGGSHRLQYDGGHGDSVDCVRYAAACKYMLGAR